MTDCPWCGFAPPIAFEVCPECGLLISAGLDVPAPEAPRLGDPAPEVMTVKTGTALDWLSDDAAGIPLGVVMLLAGNPGVGKSTLSLLVADGWASGGGRSSTIWTWEEDTGRILARAQRAGIANRDVRISERWPLLRRVRPRELWVLDSVQRAEVHGVRSEVESQAHAIEVAAVMRQARSRGDVGAILLLSHATKEGDVAGANALKHDVDVVLTLHRLAGTQTVATCHLLSCEKNRYGPIFNALVAWPMEMR